MRPYKGGKPSVIQDPKTRPIVESIDEWIRDADAAFARINLGLKPSGSGGPLGGVSSHHSLTDLTNFDDHSQYLYLAGRTTQQTVTNVDNAIVPLLVKGKSGTTAELFRADTNLNIGFHVLSDGRCSIRSLGGDTGTSLDVNIDASTATHPNLAITSDRGVGTSGTYQIFSTVGYGGGSKALEAYAMTHYHPNGPIYYVASGTLGHEGQHIFTSDAVGGLTGPLHLIRGKIAGALVATVQGASAQTADLSRWIDSSSNLLASVSAAGVMRNTGLILEDPGAGTNTISINAPATPTTHTLTLPGANANGQLANNGSGTLSWATPNLLDSNTHGDTSTGTVVRGDIIVGNSTPKWSRLAKGGSSTVLRSDGTDPSWGTIDKGYIDNRTRSIWFGIGDFTGTTTTMGTADNQSRCINFGAVSLGEIFMDFAIPHDYVSGAAVDIYWSPSNTDTGGIVFHVVYHSFGVNEDITAAGTDNTVTSAGPGTANWLITDTTTIDDGPVAGDYMRIAFSRDPVDANDTFTGTVRFLGMRFSYTADM